MAFLEDDRNDEKIDQQRSTNDWLELIAKQLQVIIMQNNEGLDTELNIEDVEGDL